jgi:hypothetical protein
MTYNATTTLRRIRDASPCEAGWRKLLAYLGKTCADDEQLHLLTVLESNGLTDALWVIDKAMTDDRLSRHFRAAVAETVLPMFERQYPGDMRVRDQIAMLRNDDATRAERAAAAAAAWDAADDADTSAADAGTFAAARDAARDAAAAAAYAAKRDAAWAAADAAARGAEVASADASAWGAARAAARSMQERILREMIGSAA